MALHPDIAKLYEIINDDRTPQDIESIRLFLYMFNFKAISELNEKFRVDGFKFYSVPDRIRSSLGFWHHQFVKCKWFKEIVLHESIKDFISPVECPTNPTKIKLILNRVISKPLKRKVVIPRPKDNLLVLGEPALRENRLTKNGYEDLKTMKCDLTGRNTGRQEVFWPYNKKIKPGYKAIRPLE